MNIWESSSWALGALSLQTIHVMDGFGHRELSGMAWAMTVLSHDEADVFGCLLKPDMARYEGTYSWM